MIIKVEQNTITKYETDTFQDIENLVKEVDKNQNDFKMTYTAKSGKYELVVRNTTGKEKEFI